MGKKVNYLGRTGSSTNNKKRGSWYYESEGRHKKKHTRREGGAADKRQNMDEKPLGKVASTFWKDRKDRG